MKNIKVRWLNLLNKGTNVIILKRLDGKSLKQFLPKRKDLKIIIKCDKCGYERQSNSYDVLNKGSTLCIKCCDNKPINGYNFRKSKEYRKNMSKAIKSSKKYKAKRHIVNKAVKNYWKKVRGGKELEEIYDEWELYRKLVYKLTERSYRKYKKNINPENFKRGRGKYHVDHKFSVLEGFKNNILPKIIADPSNLQMLTEKENISKDFRCSITKRQLLEGAGVLEL